MRRILATGGVVAAVIVASWHIVARLLEVHRRLAGTGELDERRARRRRARVERAIIRARARGPLWSARERVLVPVHASVQVGAVRDADIDIDDIGLLDASMRRAARAARERPAVARAPLPMIVPTRSNDFTWLEQQRPAAARLVGPMLLVAGAAVTLAPLVRPLGDAAPWLALVALCLVAAGWMLVRDGD